MRTPFLLALLVTVGFGGAYFFYYWQPPCATPITYRLGALDERFSLTEAEALRAFADAAGVWERSLDEDLFVRTTEENADLVVNFVYDERQALADAAAQLEARLEASRDINSAISNTYNELVAEYETLEARYEARVEAFDERLAAYNADVARYNDAGGAPPGVFEALEERRAALDEAAAEIDALAASLNELVEKINTLGERGNRLVASHNEHVERYNETFASRRQFTQGDYTGDMINVYTFEDRDELVLVLAHEFGHALGIGHVENDASIMYYLMGGQPQPLTLSAQDKQAYTEACEHTQGWSWLHTLPARAANWAAQVAGGIW